MYFILLIFLTFFYSALQSCSFNKSRWEGKDEIHRLACLQYPLFGFGQVIMPKNSFMLSSMAMFSEGIDYKYSEGDPMMMYGLTDKSTLSIIFPIISERINRQPLFGLGNITLMLEHAFINTFDGDSALQLTVLGSALLPTAKTGTTASIDVSLAQPSTSFFIGTTAHHISPKWYVYAEAGALIEIPSNQTKYGTVYLYNLGFSFPLRNKPKSFISLMLEASGRFRPSNKVNGVINDNTGSNRIWLGPSLNWGYSDITFQIGFQYPITERFFNPRKKPSYRLGVQIFFF